MTYSYYIGIFDNFSLDIMQWVFLLIITFLFMVGISSIISFNKHTAKNKTLYVIAYFVLSLFAGGVVGIVVSIITHFITYAFVSDFRKDYT